MEFTNKVEVNGIVKSMSNSKPLRVMTSEKGNSYIRFILEQVNPKGKKNRIVCMAFGHIAELAYEYENKQVLVLGTIEFSSYKDKMGNWQNSVSVNVQQITPLEHDYKQKFTSIEDLETIEITEKDIKPAKEIPTPKTINEPTQEDETEAPVEEQQTTAWMDEL